MDSIQTSPNFDFHIPNKGILSTEIKIEFIIYIALIENKSNKQIILKKSIVLFTSI